MKINEVMVETQYVRGPAGKTLAAADKQTKVKANRDKATALTAQKNAPSAEEPAAAETPGETPPAATSAAKPNYGAGGTGMPNMQATPVSKVTGKPAPGATTPPAGATKPGATSGTATTPDSEVTLANPTPPGTATGAAAPADDTNKGWQGKGAGGNLPGASFLKGFTKAAGMTDATNAIDAAQQSNIDYDLMAKQKADADKNKQGEPAADPSATPAAEPNTAKPGQPVTLANPIGQPGAAKPGATPNYGPKAAQPVTLDDPAAKPGAAAPDKETTLANPIAKPGEEKPGAAKGKSMSKQEILSWIGRNDEDNAALQSFKDAIAAAEKAGAPAGTDYSKATPGIQNVQAAPGKISYAPKTAAAAPKGPATVSASMPQPQMASKQYKKAPL
jgi:hypothetical protein